MTLLVALANPEVAVLIADRRISNLGRVIEDEYNKVTVLFCADARMAVAFTGVATLQDFDASIWIAQTLHSIANENSTVHEVIEGFRERLSRKFRALSGLDLRFTVLFCGFVYWDPNPEPRIFVVSNFELGDHEITTFTLRSLGSSEGKLLEFAGSTAGISDLTKSRLLSLLDHGVTGSDLVRFSVKHIQKSAASQLSHGTIGQQCNAAIIQSTVNTPITSTYHTARNASFAYGPNVVVAGGLISLGTEVMADSVLAGPDIRKRDPCWCESGLLFKHCHLKKYGGVYLRLPSWNRPLFYRVETQREVPVPAGSVFCVQGGYA